MAHQTFAVDGLKCAGCADTVTQALVALDGVSAVDVELFDGAPASVRIQADQVLDTDRVQSALAAKGDFRVHP
ncbi:MAG: heavy-metal-associated domain-containing protein [Mycobacterium sp.]